MNQSYPRRTSILVNSGIDNEVKFDLNFDQDTATPDVIADYLRHHGWTCVGTHPDTAEDLWQNQSLEVTNYGYYRWEQAVAFQMFLFMNIGPT